MMNAREKRSKGKGQPRSHEPMAVSEGKSIHDVGVDNEEGEDDVVEACLRRMAEKRSDARIDALAILRRHIKANPLDIADPSETLIDTLLRIIIKDNSDTETDLASNVLSTILVADPHSVRHVILPSRLSNLSSLVKKTVASPLSRGSVGTLLSVSGIASYFTGEGTIENQIALPHETILTILTDAINVSIKSKKTGEGEGLTRLIKAWSALACVYPLARQAGELNEYMTNTMLALILDPSQDTNAKNAACELLCLLVESRQIAKKQGIESNYGSLNVTKSTVKAIGLVDLGMKIDDYDHDLIIGGQGLKNERKELKKTIELLLDLLLQGKSDGTNSNSNSITTSSSSGSSSSGSSGSSSNDVGFSITTRDESKKASIPPGTGTLTVYIRGVKQVITEWHNVLLFTFLSSLSQDIERMYDVDDCLLNACIDIDDINMTAGGGGGGGGGGGAPRSRRQLTLVANASTSQSGAPTLTRRESITISELNKKIRGLEIAKMRKEKEALHQGDE